MTELFVVLVISFLSFHMGKLSGRLSVHPCWSRWWDLRRSQVGDRVEPLPAKEDEYEIVWQHNECGTEVDHDAEFCHQCGELIDKWTDEQGVHHDGFPMWELGEN